MKNKQEVRPQLVNQLKELVAAKKECESNAPKMYDCDILGGAIASMKQEQYILYLINTGHELVWVHEHQVNQAATNSLGENLVGENIIVWWHDKAQGSKPTSYTGKIVAFRENDADRHETECSNQRGPPTISNRMGRI